MSDEVVAEDADEGRAAVSLLPMAAPAIEYGRAPNTDAASVAPESLRNARRPDPGASAINSGASDFLCFNLYL